MVKTLRSRMLIAYELRLNSSRIKQILVVHHNPKTFLLCIYYTNLYNIKVLYAVTRYNKFIIRNVHVSF